MFMQNSNNIVPYRLRLMQAECLTDYAHKVKEVKEREKILAKHQNGEGIGEYHQRYACCPTFQFKKLEGRLNQETVEDDLIE
nr:unnamed protein product [Callosobruchus analis]